MSAYEAMKESVFNEAWAELSTIKPLRSTIIKMRRPRYGEYLNSLIIKWIDNAEEHEVSASEDIIQDLLVELGFTPEDVTSHLRILMQACFCLGHNYTGEDTSEPAAYPNDLNRVEGVPDWLYCNLRDEAAEAMITQAAHPNEYHKGLWDMALSAFQQVSDNSGEDAEKVVLRRALDLNSQRR